MKLYIVGLVGFEALIQQQQQNNKYGSDQQTCLYLNTCLTEVLKAKQGRLFDDVVVVVATKF